MAMLASKGVLGYVPLPTAAVKLIASYINVHPEARVFDPCAGEGRAILAMAQAWGVDHDRLYLNEIDQGRFAYLEQLNLPHLTHADALKDLVCSKNMFGLGYLNPPFDWEDQENRDGDLNMDRKELKFWQRLLEGGDRNGHAVQGGGVAVLVSPRWVMATDKVVHHFAKTYDDLQLFRLPDDHREYGEMVAIGYVRELPRKDAEKRTAIKELKSFFGKIAEFPEQCPVLSAQPRPIYHVPAPLANVRPVWKSRANSTPAQARRDITRVGGAWRSAKYEERTRQLGRAELSSVFPLNPRQAMLRVAAGAINGAEIELAHEQVIVKGSTVPGLKEWSEEHMTERGLERKKFSRRTFTPVVTTLTTAGGPRGKTRRYQGDQGIASLCQIAGASDALVAEVRKTVKQRYNMDMPEAYAHEMLSIQPANGYKLPGQKRPGMVNMQMHVVAAVVNAAVTPDPSWGNKVPRAAFVSADPGAGKTLMGIALMRVIRRCHSQHRRQGRAFTAIISAPNHLIGKQKHIDAFHKGKALKAPQWYTDITNFWPGCHLKILESTHDAAMFFAHAERNPETPHIGMISNSNLSLASGYEVGCEERTADSLARVIASHAQPGSKLRDPKQFQVARGVYGTLNRKDQLAAYAETVEELRKEQRRRDRAERVFNANDVDDNVAASGDDLPFQPGVSPRTMERDRQVREGWVPRMGWTCAHCGRPVLTPKSELADRKFVYARGIKGKCDWCREPLNAQSRERDNVGDRKLSVYKHEAQRPFYVNARGERVIPWGDKPRSNPKMALGYFIGRRYKGKIDVYLCDEVHECKAGETAVGRSFGKLRNASDVTFGLTGTLYGGKASDLYALLLRMGNIPVIQAYGWNSKTRFIRECGVMDTITTQTFGTDAVGRLNGEVSEPSSREEERPGITARLAAIVQNCAAQVLLPHMGFKLPHYQEIPVWLDLDSRVEGSYGDADANGKRLIQKTKRALGSYLQTTLLMPYAPWLPMQIDGRSAEDKKDGARMDLVWEHEPLAASLILPHHEKLAEIIGEQKKRGRRVLLFCQHTGTKDVMPDVVAKVSDLLAKQGISINMAILRSSVEGGDRDNWFAQRAAEGVDVVVCHPMLVRAGMNLIQWPCIIFLEPNYSLFVTAQAKKRAFRPTQTEPCEVYFVGYKDTMVAMALSIVARKSAAAAIMSGDNLNEGMMEVDGGMSLFAELASRVADETAGRIDEHEIATMFAAGAQSVRDQFAAGAHDLGIEEDALAIPEVIELQPDEYSVVDPQPEQTRLISTFGMAKQETVPPSLFDVPTEAANPEPVPSLAAFRADANIAPWKPDPVEPVFVIHNLATGQETLLDTATGKEEPKPEFPTKKTLQHADDVCRKCDGPLDDDDDWECKQCCPATDRFAPGSIAEWEHNHKQAEQTINATMEGDADAKGADWQVRLNWKNEAWQLGFKQEREYRKLLNAHLAAKQARPADPKRTAKTADALDKWGFKNQYDWERDPDYRKVAWSGMDAPATTAPAARQEAAPAPVVRTEHKVIERPVFGQALPKKNGDAIKKERVVVQAALFE